MKKRLFALLCALVLLTTAIPSAGALAGEANRSADILSTLGLVNGTTNAGYDLTSPATRAQAAVLLVRLAGAEEAAAADPWFAGYRDVPAWCKDAVDYATHQGWLTGVTPLDFQPNTAITANAWCTSLLRMLGYSDENGDFSVSDAALFAQRIGLISVAYSGTLTRGDMFEIARDALTFSYKDGSGTLIEHLVDSGCTSRSAASALGLLAPELTARQVADRHMAAVFRLDLYKTQEEIDAIVEKAAELVLDAGALDVLVADTPAKMKDAWAARSSFLEGIEEQTKLLDECDVVVPTSRIADFVGYVKSIEPEFGFAVKSFGHAGDGNLHIYTCANDMELDEFKKQVDTFMTKIYDKATEMGGLVSGEHGIGMGKIEYLARSVGETNMKLMEDIKKVFDPNLILNPGKVCYKL